MTVIAIKNIIVWPRIPQAHQSVKETMKGADNVVVLPIIRIERFSKPEPTYNDIQKIVAKTMRGQRATKHNPHVIKKLRAMFKYPA